VLAAIEDQQHPSAAKETYQTAGWIRGLNRQPERRGHRARDEKRIVERSKIKKLNGTGKLGKQLIIPDFRLINLWWPNRGWR
jgi:hypothetical protein